MTGVGLLLNVAVGLGCLALILGLVGAARRLDREEVGR